MLSLELRSAREIETVLLRSAQPASLPTSLHHHSPLTSTVSTARATHVPRHPPAHDPATPPPSLPPAVARAVPLPLTPPGPQPEPIPAARAAPPGRGPIARKGPGGRAAAQRAAGGRCPPPLPRQRRRRRRRLRFYRQGRLVLRLWGVWALRRIFWRGREAAPRGTHDRLGRRALRAQADGHALAAREPPAAAALAAPAHHAQPDYELVHHRLWHHHVSAQTEQEAAGQDKGAGERAKQGE